MLDRYLQSPIPLGEAADYFIRLKKFAEYGDPPDHSGQLEGAFAVAPEQVVAAIAEIATAKIRLAMTYRVYSETLRDPSSSGLSEHFKEHSEEVLEAADFFMRRAAVLSGPVHLGEIDPPPPATDLHTILTVLIRAEQEGIAHLNQFLPMLGENPMKYEVEQLLATDQHHLDDMWQHIPHEATVQPNVGEKQAMSKTAAPGIERFLPGTDRYHGSVMKLALQSIKPTVFTVDQETIDKEANAMAPLTGAAAGQHGPPAAMAPLGPGAMGDHKMADFEDELEEKFARAMSKLSEKSEEEHAEAGHHRAIGNLSSRFTANRHSKAERHGDLVGRILGVLGGGAAGKHLTKGKGPAVELAGALGGAALGQHLTGKAGKMVGEEIDSHLFHKKYKKASAFFKQALDGMTPTMPQSDVQPQVGGVQQEEPQPEQAGQPQGIDPKLLAYMQQEQEGGAAAEQNEAAFYKERFQQASQELQGAQAAAQQSGEQMAQLQQQMQATSDQTTQIQQAAMGNVQASQAASAQAMQQTLAKSTELTQQMQLAANMRDAMQQMKENLMQVATSAPPPATTMESGAMATQMAPPENQAGMPGAEAGGQAPPQAAPPGGQGPETAGPGPGQEPVADQAAPQGQAGQMEQPKVGSVDPRILGALGGAAVGGIGTAIESRMSHEGLRDKVHKLEHLESHGQGGFGTALNLAQAKMRLAMGEISERHPVGATIAGTLLGASAGAGAGPALKDIFHAYHGT